MRFMVIMIPGNRKDVEAGIMPSGDLIAKMMKYNEELVKAGIMLAGDGLHPSSKGARITFNKGKGTITDGPFTEAREIIGGYWMWQVKSKEEAVAWASRCPALDGDTLEIRRVYDPSDFGPEVAAKEHALMDEIGKQMEKNKQK